MIPALIRFSSVVMPDLELERIKFLLKEIMQTLRIGIDVGGRTILLCSAHDKSS